MHCHFVGVVVARLSCGVRSQPVLACPVCGTSIEYSRVLGLERAHGLRCTKCATVLVASRVWERIVALALLLPITIGLGFMRLHLHIPDVAMLAATVLLALAASRCVRHFVTISVADPSVATEVDDEPPVDDATLHAQIESH